MHIQYMSYILETRKNKSFDEKISKLSTKHQQSIKTTIKSFTRFCKECYQKDLDVVISDIKKLDENIKLQAIYTVFQDWIDWQYDNGSLTSTVKQYVSKIRKYLIHCEVRYHIEDFDDQLEYKPRIKEELHELTLDEIQKIFSVTTPRKRGFYLALISTGARPGELLQVRKRDIDTCKRRIKIRLEAENVKTRVGRSVYMTKESSEPLLIRLQNLNDDDLVWAKNSDANYAEKNESSIFNRLTEKVGFDQRYLSNNFRKISLYSFRSYFFGRAADVHREAYAHRMAGHGGYLPQYDRMSDEKRLEWFMTLEPELTIDSTERQKLRIEKQDKVISELRERGTKIDEMTEKIDFLTNELEKVKQWREISIKYPKK